MNDTPKLLDVVALLEDIPDHDLFPPRPGWHGERITRPAFFIQKLPFYLTHYTNQAHLPRLALRMITTKKPNPAFFERVCKSGGQWSAHHPQAS
ncbi:hypothetical protein [Roseiflexus sp.]|uniref:hypothetical protein n=1 Tax=Roseiflexus sp. TaxID=2562120 RepID=UPI0025877056|nr:hypothetical protein [Roseiflexus sp.]